MPESAESGICALLSQPIQVCLQRATNLLIALGVNSVTSQYDQIYGGILQAMNAEKFPDLAFETVPVVGKTDVLLGYCQAEPWLVQPVWACQ